MLLAVMLVTSVIPLQTAKADMVGSGGGGGATGYSNSFLAWGNIPNGHSGIRVSVVDSDGKNQLQSPALELATNNKNIRVSVDILGDTLYENLKNGTKRPHYYTENKFGYGDREGFVKLSISTIVGNMILCMKKNSQTV